MKLFSLPTLLASALLSVLVSIPFLPFANPKEQFRFEVALTSSAAGKAQIYYDVGRGFSESDSVSVTVEATAQVQHLTFDLPAATYRALRFDPINRAATITLADVAIRDPNSHVVRRFSPTD